MASRSSSETRRTSDGGAWARLAVALAVVALFASVGFGCVTVRPEEKEFLAQPSMTYGADGQTRAHDEHVFTNREGAFGAGGVGGGGCGCN